MKARSKTILFGLLGLGLTTALTAACLSDQDQGVVEVDPSCTSGVRWVGPQGPGVQSPEENFGAAHQGAPEMHPGGRCLDCHGAAGGPRFLIAGTVFPKLKEPNNCYGEPNVKVHITDAKGIRYTLRSNIAGNFFLRAADAPSFAFPFKAEIRYGDRISRMFPEQDNGNCNSCHTPEGKNDAPGRICADPDDPLCNLL